MAINSANLSSTAMLSQAALSMQAEGVRIFTAYVRKLIADRAREEYSALVESTGTFWLSVGYSMGAALLHKLTAHSHSITVYCCCALHQVWEPLAQCSG